MKVIEGRRVREWSLQQRIEQSRRRRGNSEMFQDHTKGRKHYELVRHPRCCNAFEWNLAYEAMINGTTTEEWIQRHRIDGKLIGNEIYLPPGTYVVCLDKDLFNTSFENLYCFTTKQERLVFNSKVSTIHNLSDNKEKVRELATRYTKERRRQLTALGHTAIS